MTATENPVVAGRHCGTCTLCCKLLAITALDKPRGSWCMHCSPGAGCAIYAERPAECRSFHCGYLTLPDLGEEWYPQHAKIVLIGETGGRGIGAHVDPQRPDAWRREPYYAQLKQWAVRGAPRREQVAAYVGRRMYMILPDKDVDLGVVGDDEIVVMSQKETPFGPTLDAFKIKTDDPRAQALGPEEGEGM